MVIIIIIIIIIIVIIIVIIIIIIIIINSWPVALNVEHKSKFFLRLNEVTEIFLRVGLTQGILALWRRLASSPAAQRQYLSDGFFLKTAYVYCDKNCGSDYFIPRVKLVNKK